MVYCTVLVVSAGQTNSWYVGQTVLDSRFDTAHKVNTALFLLWHYFGDGLIDIQIWSMIHRWSQKTHGLLKAVLLVCSTAVEVEVVVVVVGVVVVVEVVVVAGGLGVALSIAVGAVAVGAVAVAAAAVVLVVVVLVVVV